jgi:hypothetical protein
MEKAHHLYSVPGSEKSMSDRAVKVKEISCLSELWVLYMPAET